MLPKVSFVIPTLNSESTLDLCLKSIVKQDYPSLEIIVVDGGSTDSTARIASRYTSKILYERGPLGRARQVGADNCDGEVLGIFDSDTALPSSSWLKNAVKHFINNERVGVVWPINKAPINSPLTTQCYFNFWSVSLVDRLKRGKRVLPGGNSLILKRAFDEAGGFNAQLPFGEDMDLTYRVIRLGYRAALFEDPIIHNSMRSFKEFLNKQIKGSLTLTKVKKHSEMDLLHICMTWRPQERYRLQFGELFKDLLVEHVYLGFKGMFTGLIKDRDKSWVIFPVLLFIRLFVYGSVFLISQIKFFKLS